MIGRCRTRLTGCLIVLLLASLLSCTREDYSIAGFNHYPIIAVDYRNDGSVVATQALTIMLAMDVAEVAGEFLVAVTSPDGLLCWERAVRLQVIDGISYLGVNGLMLPEGNRMAGGSWTVEVVHPDGRMISQQFAISDTQWNMPGDAAGVLSTIPRARWVSTDEGKSGLALDTGEAPDARAWSVRLVDASQSVVASGTYRGIPITSARFTSNASQAVVAEYWLTEESSGILLMGRSELR